MALQNSMKTLRTILVDLVPLLPGAENGGAKIFVIELIRNLSRIAPQTHFILLTRRSSHNELTSLECANVSRKLVWDDLGAKHQGLYDLQKWKGMFSAIVRRLPKRFRWIAFKLRNYLSRNANCSAITNPTPDLVFLPFGLSQPSAAPISSYFHVPTVTIFYDLQHKHFPRFFSPDEFAIRERNFQDHCQRSVISVISDFVRNSVLDEKLVNEEFLSLQFTSDSCTVFPWLMKIAHLALSEIAD